MFPSKSCSICKTYSLFVCFRVTSCRTRASLALVGVKQVRRDKKPSAEVSRLFFDDSTGFGCGVVERREDEARRTKKIIYAWEKAGTVRLSFCYRIMTLLGGSNPPANGFLFPTNLSHCSMPCASVGERLR